MKCFGKLNTSAGYLIILKNDKEVKKALVKLLEKNILYEWCRAEILDCLTRSQEFSIKELWEDFFQQLKTEHSWYVKKSIYRLLLSLNVKTSSYLSLFWLQQRESYGPLRREILYFSDLCVMVFQRKNLQTFLENEFSKNRNCQKRIKDSGPTIADIKGLTEN